MTARAYLGLGSNLGDRVAYLQSAVDALDAAPGVRVVGVSGVYETVPLGGPPQGAFLNAVVAVDTDLAPRALLALCHVVEDAAERVREERWGPRTLDVDVLLYDDVEVDGGGLTIPHPRMSERGFVLAPLSDLAPDIVTAPVDGWKGVSRTAVTLCLPRSS